MGNDRVVGIDLGTTNSLVACLQGGQPVVIPGEDGAKLAPSLVAVEPADGGRIIVGNAAAPRTDREPRTRGLLGEAV